MWLVVLLCLNVNVVGYFTRYYIVLNVGEYFTIYSIILNVVEYFTTPVQDCVLG